jgi:hypothetical protein
MLRMCGRRSQTSELLAQLASQSNCQNREYIPPRQHVHKENALDSAHLEQAICNALEMAQFSKGSSSRAIACPPSVVIWGGLAVGSFNITVHLGRNFEKAIHIHTNTYAQVGEHRGEGGYTYVCMYPPPRILQRHTH